MKKNGVVLTKISIAGFDVVFFSRGNNLICEAKHRIANEQGITVLKPGDRFLLRKNHFNRMSHGRFVGTGEMAEVVGLFDVEAYEIPLFKTLKF